MRGPTTLALAALALAAPAAALGADAWPMPGHDAGRSARSAATSAPRPAVVRGWPVSGGDLVLLPPGGGALMTTSSGRYVLRRRDGRGRLLPRDFAVAAYGPDGRRYAIGAGAPNPVSAYAPDGRLLWRTPSGVSAMEASERYVLAAPDGTVFAAGDAGVTAIARDGRVRWTRPQTVGDPPGPVALAVGPDGTAAFVAGSGAVARLVAVAPDGATRWERPLATGGQVLAVDSDGTILVAVAVAVAGKLLSYSATGEPRWSAPIPPCPSGAALGRDGTVYVAGSPLVPGSGPPRCAAGPGRVRAIGPGGTIRWTAPAPAGVHDPAVGGDGTIYAAGRSSLLALRADGRRRWAYRPPARARRAPLAPVQIGGDGTLYAGRFAFAGPRPARHRTAGVAAFPRPGP